MLYSSHFLFEKFMEKIISSQTVDTELRELIEEWNEACVKLLHFKNHVRWHQFAEKTMIPKQH